MNKAIKVLEDRLLCLEEKTRSNLYNKGVLKAYKASISKEIIGIRRAIEVLEDVVGSQSEDTESPSITNEPRL